MPLVDHRLEVPPGRTMRADRAVQEMTFLSRSGLFGLFDHGCVAVNGAPCRKAGATVRGGDVIEVRYDPHRRYQPRPSPPLGGPFRIVFEDEHLLVVDKQSGVLTVPTDSHETDTLVHEIGRHLGGGGAPRRVEVVHRPDRDASGLLVVAKNKEVAEQLVAQFAGRKPEREYVALVAGLLEQEDGVFESRLVDGWHFQRHSTDEPGEGEIAISRYRVERRLDAATRVRVTLETGRRNQIRVQFAEAGHPVIGDRRYAPDLARHPRWRLRRIALHAAVLGFQHPVTGEAMRFESRPPRAFTEFEEGEGKPVARPRPAFRSKAGRGKPGRPAARSGGRNAPRPRRPKAGPGRPSADA
jgi:23S rRNA pseudouridine1911/1915/1917 synthase